MSKHQASEQMIGYLYQVRYALALLLDSDDADMKISIERFDDIAFSKDDEPKVLIQMKHHIKKIGKLTNSSTDLWRTLKVWIDQIEKKPNLLEQAKFLIITTAVAPVETAAFFLKDNKYRDYKRAYGLLKTVSEESKNTLHQDYYEAFKNINEDKAIKILSKIYVLDNSSNILEIERTIKRTIRFCCLPKYERQIYDRLEGWWFGEAIKALCSDTPVYFTQNQVRSLIVQVSQQYTEDNLPIETWYADELNESDLAPDERIFYDQLKLIMLSDRRIHAAIRDYYRAYNQRANWIRNELLFVNDLEIYEDRLLDEWERYFGEMEEQLNDYISPSEEEKIKCGRQLFNNIERQDIRIRPKCSERFVMRGTYHILANEQKVGWHIDFIKRLKTLLSA